ncbi:MAG: helix-turn-helix domain-containing protein [Deltaproteobacteria bacterium]|nr:helix-turn-helix domain-containing protein [Deltaproteobacteria bacterium]
MFKSKYLSTEEAASYLGISLAALRMALHRDHLQPTGRIGSRLLFTEEDLDKQITRLVEKKSCAANEDLEHCSLNEQRMPSPRREAPLARRPRRKPSTKAISLRNAVREARSK